VEPVDPSGAKNNDHDACKYKDLGFINLHKALRHSALEIDSAETLRSSFE
jgi:hypothetical protein